MENLRFQKNGFDLRELLEQIVQLYTVSAMQKILDCLYTMDENIPIHHSKR